MVGPLATSARAGKPDHDNVGINRQRLSTDGIEKNLGRKPEEASADSVNLSWLRPYIGDRRSP